MEHTDGTGADAGRAVIPVLAHERLFLTWAEPNIWVDQRHCSATTPDGALVASIRETTSTSRRGWRLFAGSGTAARWDVVDATGHPALVISKPSDRLKGPAPQVSLTDGTDLGQVSAHGDFSLRKPVDLLAPGGSVLATLVDAMGERREFPVLIRRIVAPDGADLGEISYEPRDEGWGYHLLLRPGAGLSVRALSLAWIVTQVQLRTSPTML